MRTSLAVVIVGLAMSAVPLFAQTPSIEGVWEGTSIATTGGANPSSNDKRLPNLHIYTKGYWMVLSQDAAVPTPPRTAPPPLKTPGQPTDAEKIARHDFWAPVTANAGRYELKGNTLIQYSDVNKGAAGGKNTMQVRLEDGGKTLVEVVTNQNGTVTTRRYRRLE